MTGYEHHPVDHVDPVENFSTPTNAEPNKLNGPFCPFTAKRIRSRSPSNWLFSNLVSKLQFGAEDGMTEIRPSDWGPRLILLTSVASGGL